MSDRFRDQIQDAIGPGYTIEREITGGGMSRVYVATEHALGRTVVIKVLRAELAAGVNRERFRREVMLAAQLQHPHIVPLLSAGEHGDLLWYTMPFVEGESLREALARGSKFSPRDVARVLHDVLDALAYAHRRGVIHRDIKPGNILRHGSHSLVTDFGVAKALSASMPHSGTTSLGIAIGTPAYMAPEQLAADPNADHRMDLYAVGLLSYELLTGEQPFQGLSPQATMAAQLTRMPRALEESRPDVPPELAAVIMKLLEKEPANRPETALAALEMLDDMATPTSRVAASAITAPGGPTTVPIAITPSGQLTPAATTPGAGTAPASSSSRAMLIGLAAIAVVALGAVALIVRNGRTTAPPPAAVPAALTHDDSIRIAEAVRLRVDAARQIDAKRVGGDRNLDSLKQAVSRELADSTRRARRLAVRDSIRAAAPRSGGAPATGKGAAPAPAAAPKPPSFAGRPRRVALLPVRDATTRPELAPLARALEDSLRRAFTAEGYTMASDAELVRLLAISDMNAQRRAADSMGIGAVVTGLTVLRGNEVSAQTLVLDIWRGMPSSQHDEGDLDDAKGALNVVRDAVRAVKRVSWRQRSDPRRIVIFDFDNQTGRPDLGAAANELADSLRAAARRFNLEVVNDAPLRATVGVNERRAAAEQVGAGAIAVATLSFRRGDTVSVRLSLRDMSEDRTLNATEVRAPVTAIPSAAAALIEQLSAGIAQINWGPRGTMGR